ncbi:hypothetical protein J3A83DRAFT_4368612 [Scleroderma citrinum]
MSPATFQPLSDVSRMTHVPPQNHVIDPVLVPLPSSQDDDLSVPAVIAQSQGHVASPNTVGACCPDKDSTCGSKSKVSKSKDKENVGMSKLKKHPHDVIDLDDEDKAKARHGCPHGVGNYSCSDMNALLDFVEEELPLGQCGWQSVAAKFNKWAVKYGQPEWKLTSLKMKYKQLVKTPKPTGTGVCPLEVLQAHHIDDLVNEQAGTHELNDSEYDNIIEIANKPDSSDNDKNNTIPECHHTAVAHSAHMDTPSTHHNA